MRRVDGLREIDRCTLAACALSFACSAGDSPAAHGSAATGSAAVGPAAVVSVAEGVVRAIEQARGVTREQALAFGTEDALLAEGLRAREPRVGAWIERTVLARQVLAAIADEARAGGPPTDAEVEALTYARFWELARPRLVRVVHAVVLASKEDEAARALAEQIAAATRGAQTPAQFQTAARGVPAGNLKVKVETLQPVAADGRAIDPAAPPPNGPGVQQLNADFAAAAQRLSSPGEQSPVVRTPFGYHVIYLIAVIEPKQPSLDERRALLHDEIMTQRAQTRAAELLAEQRRALVPEQERSALTNMQRLSSERESQR